jgi:hypothetical protein
VASQKKASAMKNRRRRRISDFKPDPLRNAGIAWYEPQHYARMLEIMDYPASMSRSYERWREVAENQERTLKRAGRLVARIVIDPDKFLAWCAAHAMKPNHNAVDFLVADAIGWHWAVPKRRV